MPVVLVMEFSALAAGSCSAGEQPGDHRGAGRCVEGEADGLEGDDRVQQPDPFDARDRRRHQDDGQDEGPGGAEQAELAPVDGVRDGPAVEPEDDQRHE